MDGFARQVKRAYYMRNMQAGVRRELTLDTRMRGREHSRMLDFRALQSALARARRHPGFPIEN